MRLDVTNVTTYRNVMQPTLTLGELIDAARRSGRSTSDLMLMAKCSRMNLWRLQAGKVPETSPSGVRLRSALEGDPLSKVMDTVSSSIRNLIADDPRRADEVLAMLRSVTALVQQSDRDKHKQ